MCYTVSVWPRQESNLDLELRKLLYYPLYYEAFLLSATFKFAHSHIIEFHISSLVHDTCKYFYSNGDQNYTEKFSYYSKPFGPRAFLSTLKMLSTMINHHAIDQNTCKILISSKLAFNDMIVVSVPEPAISGKAIGTTLPLLGLLSGLKNSTPRIISSPRMKMTMLPATANDWTSRPIRFRKGLP